MTTRQPLGLKELAPAAGVAAACALAMGLGLAWASAPPQFSARLAGLSAEANQARDLMRTSPVDRLYSQDAFCRAEPASTAKTLRDSLSATAAQANLSVDFLEAHPEAPAEGLGVLTPIRLKFTVTGSYEGVVALLAALARQRPDVFADGLDVTAKTANVTASFSGRAFCAT